MLRRHVVTIAATSLAAATLAGSASAQRTFAERGQTIRAGVVILESAHAPVAGAEPVSFSPHLWFNLDSNQSVKPAGWTFVNPHASTVLSGADRNRWATIQSSGPLPPVQYRVPAPGSRLTKRMAPYWEVRLANFNDAQLASYDVLVVSPGHSVQLNPSEREKLRRFVDRGGVLWIDPSAIPADGSSSRIDTGNGFPLPFDIRTTTGAPEFKDFGQPLLSSPQTMSLRDVNMISSATDAGSFARDLVAPNFAVANGTERLFAESYVGFASLKPVIGQDFSRFSVGVGRIGDGFVVVTSRAAAMKLNRVKVAENPTDYSYSSNLNFFSRDANLQVDGLAAAKLAVNMISLPREYSQAQGGSQKASSSSSDVGAPLLKRTADTTIAGLTSTPVLYKGLLVVSAGDVIRVYDADPARDMDGDSILDDGNPDGGNQGYDLVWQSNSLGTTLSSPVCIEVPATNVQRPDGSRATDQVLAVGADGRLHALDLMLFTPQGLVSGVLRGNMNSAAGYVNANYPLAAPTGSGSLDSSGADLPNPPTVHENLAYIVEKITGNQGRLWMVDLINAVKPKQNPSDLTAREWFMGGTGAALPSFSAGATIGYIPILDNSGGTDRVLYAPTSRTTVGPPTQAAGFVSIWLGSRGEKPTDFEPQGTNVSSTLQVTTRAARDGLPIFTPDFVSPYGVRLTLLRADGSVYDAQQMGALFQGVPTQNAGVLTFQFRGGPQALPADVSGIRVDYSIDYGVTDVNQLANAKRGDVLLPDRQDSPARDIIGSVALTPRGTVYLTASGAGRSALFGFREEGRGAFKCVMRYELYGQHSMGGQGVADTTVPPVFVDGDPTQLFAPAILSQPFVRFGFVGPPAVRGDMVFAAAAGAKGFVPATVLMAFKAEPETPTIYIDNFPANGAIVQPDLARSAVPSRPEVSPSFQVGQTPGMTYDTESKLLRIENLSTSPKGQLQSVLSLSQPILIRTPGGGAPDRFLYPNGASGANRFDPLLWFTVLNGFTPSRAGLIVTGNTLFMAGASPLRNILTTGNFLASEGMLYGIDTDISPTNNFLFSMAGRPWVKQLYQLKTGPTGIEGNRAQKWPQMFGAQSLDDYLIRLGQTVVPGNTVESMAAGEGVVAAIGTTGLYTYSRSDFLVADQGRIAAFDPAGNPTFEITATGNAGDDEAVGAGTARPIVRPTRAYPLPSNEILVADPGANRIFRVNRAGTETRAISRFKLDPQHAAPPNFPSNGPLTLKGPNDVLTYTTIERDTSVANFFTPSGAPFEYWSHYLIADTGNRRLVEVVDRFAYDPVNRHIGNAIELNGVPQLGVLLWHSPPATQGKGFEYNSLSRVNVGGRFVYFAGIGGALPTTTDTGGAAPSATAERETAGFGGVAVFDPLLPNGVTVFNKVGVPAFSANVFWNDVTGAFDSAARPAQNQPLVNVTSVTARPIVVGTATVVSVMITDAKGVYEVTYSPPAPGAEYVPSVQWMLPNEVYRVLRRVGAGDGVPNVNNPRDLRAMYARRLESGEVLVVNGYFGQTRGTRNADGTFSGREPFRGEVLQVSGESGAVRTNVANMGFGVRSISYSLELNQSARGLVLPVFADRR